MPRSLKLQVVLIEIRNDSLQKDGMFSVHSLSGRLKHSREKFFDRSRKDCTVKEETSHEPQFSGA